MASLAVVATRSGLGRAWEVVWRARRLVERNVMVYRHQWIVILSGVAEPIFYLVGIGMGLGGLVRTVPLPDGRTISYTAYVAPARDDLQCLLQAELPKDL